MSNRSSHLIIQRAESPPRKQETARRWSNLPAEVLGAIGRHPLAVLILPSLWFFARYLPFWKDVDVLNSLAWPFTSENLLLCPPIYCVLGRVPFWITDTLLHGTAPGILSAQHPSLEAVYALIVCQHAFLWAGLRYFVFSLPASDAGRGGATLLLASVASFYSFAHTCGAEVTTPITWFALFGVGLRILYRRTSWKIWAAYAAILVLSIGSRHVSGLLLGWLPTAAAALAVYRWRFDRTGSPGRVRAMLGIAAIALVLSGVSLSIERFTVARLCEHFAVVVRPIVGQALSDRIGSFLDRLPPEERRRVAQRAAGTVREADPQRAATVAHTVEALVTVGTYHHGTLLVIGDELARRGFSGEALNAERDRIILDATMAYYRTRDPRLVRLVLNDIVKGFYPTNDQGIAMTGAKSTFYSIPLIAERPNAWAGISGLPMFNRAIANAALERAFHDNWIRHWRFLQIGAWLALFFGIGIVRMLRQALPAELALAGFTMFGIGLVTYAANCVCNYSMPRYVLPLLVAVFACGAVLTVTRNA